MTPTRKFSPSESASFRSALALDALEEVNFRKQKIRCSEINAGSPSDHLDVPIHRADWIATTKNEIIVVTG